MISNNCRSTTVINDHLPIEETSGENSSDRKRLQRNCGNHPASNVTIDFFIWGVTYRDRTCIKPMDETDLRLLLIIRRVTVK
jgi:hypothetical protein